MGDRYRAYVLDLSYFSGKLEAYLRYKQIPFDRIEISWRRMLAEIVPKSGIARIPLVETPDGEWLQDTTPLIDWFEQRHPGPPVIPTDPVHGFAARLLEDYADEWLWRPALHYRWSHRVDALHLSRRIAVEEFYDVPLPTWLIAAFIRWRQRRVYVRGDGVTRATRAHVEQTYRIALGRLQRLFERHRFMLGDRPCLADFGFFASMFRHFGLDPTPAFVMRQEAPAVYEWLARLWNCRHSECAGSWERELPEVWKELLADAGRSYLPYLHANARAWQRGERRLDHPVDGVTYRSLPVVHYRVWCRERLQDHFEALPSQARPAVRALLEECGAWEPLWRDGVIRSGLHEGGEPPYCRPAKTLSQRLRSSRDPWNPGLGAGRG
jgi:glutathione S-transferase